MRQIRNRCQIVVLTVLFILIGLYVYWCPVGVTAWEPLGLGECRSASWVIIDTCFSKLILLLESMSIVFVANENYLQYCLIMNENLWTSRWTKDRRRLSGVNTIKNYRNYMENSWLVFTLNVYDYSVKRQQIAPKKIYCIDTGLVNKVGFGFSLNTGKLLENLVFLTIRRTTQDIYYFSSPGGYEVDFYLPESRQLIQVTQNLNNTPTREREVRALQDAIQFLKPKSALILTDANEKDFEIDGVSVSIRATAEWMLSPSVAGEDQLTVR